jgi:nucleoside-diphosphate-sugar epimerase
MTRVLVTGHDGYIGRRLVPMLLASGHDVTGLDSGLFEDCQFGALEPSAPAIRKDIRDVTTGDLEGFDAVLHLAGLSNDPLGDLDRTCTFDINHLGTLHLARTAKAAGVERFVFSSSCSLYGRYGDEMLDESAEMAPVTPYGRSKALAEGGLIGLADDGFSPTFLRNATAYGVSSRLRGDLVVNNLVAYAYTTGEVLLKSDGTPWRPLVHIDDIAQAFLCTLHAPRDVVHGEAFNIGSTNENYRVSEVADLVEELVPGSRVTFSEGAGPDPRCYRVSCEKFATTFPEFAPRWTVRRGIEQLLEAFQRSALRLEDLHSSQLMRIQHVRTLLATGQVGPDLRWRPARHSATLAATASHA